MGEAGGPTRSWGAEREAKRRTNKAHHGDVQRKGGGGQDRKKKSGKALDWEVRVIESVAG